MLAPKPKPTGLNTTDAFSERDPWRAELKLAYQERAGQTVPSLRAHVGPLRVLKGYRQSGADCWEQVVVHPPGGIASCDELSIDVCAEARARVLLTTPGATKWYRAPYKIANPSSQELAQKNLSTVGGVQKVTVNVADNASVEWLPLENIFYDGANALLETEFSLAPAAAMISADVICLGRPASHSPFLQGQLRMRTRVLRDGRPIFIERVALAGQSRALFAPAGLGGHSCFGTLIAVPALHEQSSEQDSVTLLTDLVQAVRDTLKIELPGSQVAVTALPGVLIVRWRGDNAQEGWSALHCAWRVLRMPLLERAPQAPRIWAC